MRNPSYDPATDDTRPAYPDRIEATIGGDVADLFNKVETGEVDYVADVSSAPANVLAGVQHQPRQAASSCTRYQQNAVTYISMNLGVPPFDDVHVRKALNFAYDKAGGRQLAGGALTGTNAGHIFPDGLLDNKLKDYNPYATEGDDGDIELAKAEMAQSKYDTDGDGVCDDPVVRERHRAGCPAGSGTARDGAVHRQSRRDSGSPSSPKLLDGPVIYSKCISSPDKFPLCISVGMGAGLPRRVHVRSAVLRRPQPLPGVLQLLRSLARATDQLTEWGYPGTSVPDVGDRLTECAAIPVGDAAGTNAGPTSTST